MDLYRLGDKFHTSTQVTSEGLIHSISESPIRVDRTLCCHCVWNLGCSWFIYPWGHHIRILTHYCSVPSSPTLMSNAPSRVDLSVRESSTMEGVHPEVTYNNSTGMLAVGDGRTGKRWDHLHGLSWPACDWPIRSRETPIWARELGVMFHSLRVEAIAASNSCQQTLGSIFNPTHILDAIQMIRHPH